jgi:hypothetical protein
MRSGRKVAILRTESEGLSPRLAPPGVVELIADPRRTLTVESWEVLNGSCADLLICTTDGNRHLSDEQIDLVEMFMWTRYTQEGRIFEEPERAALKKRGAPGSARRAPLRKRHANIDRVKRWPELGKKSVNVQRPHAEVDVSQFMSPLGPSD